MERPREQLALHADHHTRLPGYELLRQRLQVLHNATDDNLRGNMTTRTARKVDVSLSEPVIRVTIKIISTV